MLALVKHIVIEGEGLPLLGNLSCVVMSILAAYVSSALVLAAIFLIHHIIVELIVTAIAKVLGFIA